jgi:hypothetical protein
LPRLVVASRKFRRILPPAYAADAEFLNSAGFAADDACSRRTQTRRACAQPLWRADPFSKDAAMRLYLLIAATVLMAGTGCRSINLANRGGCPNCGCSCGACGGGQAAGGAGGGAYGGGGAYVNGGGYGGGGYGASGGPGLYADGGYGDGSGGYGAAGGPAGNAKHPYAGYPGAGPRGHVPGGGYGPHGGAYGTPGFPRHHFDREYVGPQGPPTAQVAYPYYTIRGPRDFLIDNPPSIGR